METIGQINNRQILYCNVRADRNWGDYLPTSNWLAFTIVDEEDREFLDEVVTASLNNGVCYTSSVGELYSLTDDYFDEEIVWREIQKEEESGQPADYGNTPMTTFSRNFDETFWYAAVFATATIDDLHIDLNKVVCIDCTKRRVRQHLINLCEKINDGWLPSDGEIVEPIYDEQD